MSGDGARVRIRRATPADAAPIAAVDVAAWHSTYRGMIADEHIEARTVERRTERWGEILRGDGSVAMVAEEERDGGPIVIGFVQGGSNRATAPPFDTFDAELNGLYLLGTHQRSGIGRRLVGELADALAELGHRSLILWVLVENERARRFYENLGGRLIGEADFEIDGVAYPDAAYAWDDVRDLARRLA